MEDVRPGVLQYFRFDICIFVFFLWYFFFVWRVMYLFERRNSIFVCFRYSFCCCMLFSKKQAVWRKEKEMKNKVMNILKYFVVSVFFLGICFGILVSFLRGPRH